MARADRFERIRNRRVPMERLAEQLQSFNAASATAGQELSYLVDAMQPIDEEFTKNTFAEADRVKDQLKNNLASQYSAEFDYQGSVTSDTHIRIHSDIDLLAMRGGITALDPGAPNPYPYTGNLIAELTSMRNDSAKILREKFPAADIDNSPGKAIAVQGGSLRRKVDVIVGNWWETELYKQYHAKIAKGIQIIDTKGPSLVRNKPFWHNYEIDQKDKKTGGLRKVIRLLKTLKYDAESEVGISSYDIASVAWNMRDPALTVSAYAYVPLATNARDELQRFIDNDSVRGGLKVPNGTRHVFGTDGASLSGLRNLHKELTDLIQRVQAENIISFSRTASAARPRSTPIWEEHTPQIVLKNSY